MLIKTIVDCTTGETIQRAYTAEEEAWHYASLIEPVPHSISDRQFAHQLKKLGIITHAEALAFVQTGILPNALSIIIEAIEDQEAREDAEMLISGAVEFHRNHHLTQAIATASGWSTEETDNFFREAVKL